MTACADCYSTAASSHLPLLLPCLLLPGLRDSTARHLSNNGQACNLYEVGRTEEREGGGEGKRKGRAGGDGVRSRTQERMIAGNVGGWHCGKPLKCMKTHAWNLCMGTAHREGVERREGGGAWKGACGGGVRREWEERVKGRA